MPFLIYVGSPSVSMPFCSRSPRPFGRPGLLQRVERLRQGFAVAKGLGAFPAEPAGCHSEGALRWLVDFVDLYNKILAAVGCFLMLLDVF